MTEIREKVIRNFNYKTQELAPDDNRKSFYGKAKVLHFADGYDYLVSYDTIVAAISPDGQVHRLWDGWSATTGRHIKAFCGMTKAQFTKLDVE